MKGLEFLARTFILVGAGFVQHGMSARFSFSPRSAATTPSQVILLPQTESAASSDEAQSNSSQPSQAAETKTLSSTSEDTQLQAPQTLSPIDYVELTEQIQAKLDNEEPAGEILLQLMENRPESRHELAEWIANNRWIPDSDKEPVLTDYLYRLTGDASEDPGLYQTRVHRIYLALAQITESSASLQLIAKHYRKKGVELN